MRVSVRRLGAAALLPLFALVLSACFFGGESERDLSEYFPPPPDAEAVQTEQAAPAPAAAPNTDAGGAYLPPAADLEDLTAAPANALFAVQRFFHLLSSGSLRAAYETTATETKGAITVDAFEQRYRDVFAEATIGGFTWEVVQQEEVNASSYEVILYYQTTFFGEIVESVQVATLRQPHWVVLWTPDLMFAGLGSPGYLINTRVDTPERGRILDRNGAVLAGQTEIAVVGVHWDRITDEEFVLSFFVDQLGVTEEDARTLIYQDLPSWQFIPVAVLPFDTAPERLDEIDRLSEHGILLSRQTRRFYPYGDSAAHIVGYIQEINADELEALYVEGYRAGDQIGRAGIEESFERTLAGRRGGSLRIVNSNWSPVREIAAREPIAGANVRLTIDIRAQQLAEAALGEEAGAVVAIDPRSGHLLALASFPRIDPNTIVDGVTQEEYDNYFFDARQPFINRAVEQLYAPASTFKAITLAAALEGGGYEITDRLSCPALWMEVGDVPLRNWKDDDQGLISLSQALAESCNTVFFELALAMDRLDEDLLPDVAGGFGFGAPTGLIGLNEETGVSPSPEWKVHQYNEAWFTGDSLNMSIGQGFLAVTPLQVANAYAALATNGVVGTPIIVQSIEPAGQPPVPTERRSISVLPVSAETLEQLQAALRTTVSQPYGTGFWVFRDSLLRIAGKSGTTEDLVIDAEAVADIDEGDEGEQEIATALNSQQEGQQQEEEEEELFGTHAWFSAWANFEAPQLVVTVVLDDGRSGSDDAGPIVRQVLEGAIINGWVP